MSVVRDSLVEAHRDSADDIADWRARRAVTSSSPALAATGLLHNQAWENAIADFVARRTGQQPTDLAPMAVSRAACAIGRAAFDEWLARGDANFARCLDAAWAAAATALSNSD